MERIAIIYSAFVKVHAEKTTKNVENLNCSAISDCKTVAMAYSQCIW